MTTAHEVFPFPGHLGTEGSDPVKDDADVYNDLSIYEFKVIRLTFTTGGVSGSPIAVLGLLLTSPYIEDTKVIMEHIVLNINSKFSRKRITQFFKSIGLDHVDWQRVPLASGVCKIKLHPEKWMTNRVEQFLFIEK